MFSCMNGNESGVSSESGFDMCISSDATNHPLELDKLNSRGV